MSLPPSEIPSGAMRFNSDSQKLEYWNGSAWFQVHTATPNLASAGDPTPGARGIWAGGYSPGGSTDEIRYINIASTGDTQDFGDLVDGASSGSQGGTASSSTRGLFMSGGGKFNIDFITIASTGNSQNFGNSTIVNGTYSSALSNSTRGIHAGGWGPSGFPAPSSDIIEYVTIASTGNAVDFGNLTTNVNRASGCASPTRGVLFGGRTAVSSGQSDNIQFITIATLGDSQLFGDLTTTRDTGGACSNATRGVYFPGQIGSSKTANIDYITIATMGNSTKFGDLSIACDGGTSVNSPTRGVHAISNTGSGDVNTLEYVNISTLGNAIDFGDANNAKMRHAWNASNAHGGL